MRRLPEDLTPEDIEQWMLDVGYKRDDGKVDHARVMDDAGVKSKWTVVKGRWRDGEAPEDRAKITKILLEADRRKKNRTELGRRLIALEQWDALALELLADVEIFEKQIEATRPAAEAAKAKAKAREAQREAAALEAALPFGALVPAPDPRRKQRK